MASKENIFFLRSFLLLIEGGLYISKEILSRECQKSENDLDEILKINEPKLKHLFHDKQYQKLFPKFGTADVNCWDLQLLVGVLITVFGRDLKSGEKDKLKLLRYMRNETFMHCTTAALDERKYEEVIEEIDDNITTLASTFDISVQQHCSNYIKQFTSGPLEAVRPSLPTFNGFSQLCQKKFKVGVETELVIGGPSSTWTNLCEYTLETIFNHAESMASEDGGFQEIEGNVKKMLSYLESNKDVVFKGCKRKCIILFFQCKDYESFLHFLCKVECQEYKSYLCVLSNSLHRFFKPRYPISITSQVTSESLQSVLIDIIKTLSNEEKRRHVVEVSSEDNIHENKAMTTASHDVNKENQLINQSETSLFLNLELQSEEALPQMLQSFHGKQFSDSLKKVADSLSLHYGGEITLKASMDVGAMLEALEDSVSSAVTVAQDAKTTETIYAMTSKDDLHSLSDGEKTFLADKVRIMKSVLFLRKNYILEDMMNVLTRKGLLTHQWEHFRINRKRNADIFISMVLTSPKELLEGFKQYLHDRGIYYIQKMIDSNSVTLNDKTVLSELEGSMTGKCLRPNGGKPLIKFTSQQRDLLLRELENANDIAASLLSKMIISGNEFLKISLQHTGRMGTTVLLDILEKCNENHFVDFYFAMKENGYNPSTEDFAGINQLISKSDMSAEDLFRRYTPRITYGIIKPATTSSEKQTSQKDSKNEVEPILRKHQEIEIMQQDEYQHSITEGINVVIHQMIFTQDN
ncbi:uncharacterized protein LOC132725123 [Ruditapes philippinarum]|uniref:uncharacterized protein LOC132725123 n=1 Tax=Ruditapes philippinarum TaxID=129788 RepID=UPI00295A98C8|nr:uncharacterized protein LOC132725123 [Ruditapes philippinarum]